MGKRGISPVVATVLILVILFVLVSIVAVFSVPFVRESLSGSEDCLEILGSTKFDDSKYNCNIEGEINPGESAKRTGFSVKVDGEKVAALRVAFFSGGASDIVGLEPGEPGGVLSPRVRMLGYDFCDEGCTAGAFEIPSKGEVRTYVAEGLFDKIEVSAVLSNGKVCDVSDQIEINQCIDTEVAKKILEH